MKIGISTASFFGREFTEDSLNIIKELGFDTIEVFLTTFSEYKEDFAKLLSSRKNGLNIYSIHTLNQQFEPELFNKQERTRKDCEKFFLEAGNAGGILDAKYYTFHGPARLRGRTYVFDYDWIGKRVEELYQMLQEVGKGCQLCYENVSWAYFFEPAFFENLKTKSQNIKCCLDIKQAMQSGFDASDFIPVMKNRLCNVHLCDYDENGKLFVPGKGKFNFEDFFVKLIDNGYDGPLMMELYSGNYKTYDDILEGKDYLQNCLERAKARTK